MAWHENISTCSRCQHGNGDGSCRGPCPCRADEKRRDISELASLGCPLGLFAKSDGPAAPRPSHTYKFDGSPLWLELHQRPNTFDPQRSKEEYQWLVENWSRRVPCGECAAHWTLTLKTYPPDFTSRLAYARWTWIVHNAVRRRLLQTEMDFETAAQLHGWAKWAA